MGPFASRTLIVLLLGGVALTAPAPAAAVEYVFRAVVTEVHPGDIPGPWEQSFQVGQILGGDIDFDETMAPTGFTDAGQMTSVYEFPTPTLRGIRVAGLLAPNTVFQHDVDGPHRIERSVGGLDFNASSVGNWLDVQGSSTVLGTVVVELRLGDIGTPVDYLTLPDPLLPVIPSAANQLVIRAGSVFASACTSSGSCEAVAEITLFILGPDTDLDGVPDPEDNCSLLPNGPLASTNDCHDQEDGDNDGYGNPCDTDTNNDGCATDLVDVSNTLSAAAAVLPGSRYDFDCDGAVSLQDVAQALANASTLMCVGPSGLACAGTIPCP